MDTRLTVAGTGAIYLCRDEGEHHERETAVGVSHLSPRGESIYITLVLPPCGRLRSTVVMLNRLSVGGLNSPRRQSGNLAGFECYPCDGSKVLPSHRAWVTEANPAIIPAHKQLKIYGSFCLMLNTLTVQCYRIKVYPCVSLYLTVGL